MTNKLKGKKVLITGGLGFIGSNLARRLVDLEADVLLLDSMLPNMGGNLFNIRGIKDKVTVNISDVRDVHSLRCLVEGRDFLFNLAGQTSHLDSMEDPYTDLEINCRAQLSILEACRRYNPGIRVTFASTRQIYGRPDALPVGEHHPIRPIDVNGINKAAGETYHRLYSRVFAVRACVLRMTNTYGPRMRIADARQTFLGVWIRRIVEGQRFEVWGGEQLRDLTFVDDAVDALVLAALDDAAIGEVYNLGGEPVVSLKELADLLVEVNGKGGYDVREFPSERAKIDIGDYYANWDKIRDALGWRPKTSLREGLATTLNYYRTNLPRYL